MKALIIDTIKKIEQQNDVKIIFAVESGSRAWGISSENSDYDVRFIYVHKKDWYLSIDEKKEVIQVPINDHLDINGWELRKALRLINKSNPHLFEWLHSGIMYDQNTSFAEKMKRIEPKAFQAKSALYHYLNMAKRNYLDFLQGDIIKIKKYFYVLRPVLACNWIEKYGTFPPVEISVLVEDILESGPLKQDVLALIQSKIKGEVADSNQRYQQVNHYLKEEIDRITNTVKTLEEKRREDIIDELNFIFRETLSEAWGIE
jgi:uncharacterized protein